MSGQVRDDVLAAADRIIDAFGHHRTADYFAGFAPEATFIFYTADARLESRADYERLWSSWEAENGFTVRSCVSANRRVTLIGQDAALFLHDVETVVTMDGETSTVHESETIVFERRSGWWIAIHEHLSPGATAA